jgi:hypothetical protein
MITALDHVVLLVNDIELDGRAYVAAGAAGKGVIVFLRHCPR